MSRDIVSMIPPFISMNFVFCHCDICGEELEYDCNIYGLIDGVEMYIHTYRCNRCIDRLCDDCDGEHPTEFSDNKVFCDSCYDVRWLSMNYDPSTETKIYKFVSQTVDRVGRERMWKFDHYVYSCIECGKKGKSEVEVESYTCDKCSSRIWTIENSRRCDRCNILDLMTYRPITSSNTYQNKFKPLSTRDMVTGQPMYSLDNDVRDDEGMTNGMCDKCHLLVWAKMNPDPTTDTKIYQLTLDDGPQWSLLHHRQLCAICDVHFASPLPSSVCYLCAHDNPYIQLRGKVVTKYMRRLKSRHSWVSSNDDVPYDYQCPCKDCKPWPST